MTNDLFLRAARGETTPRPPVWLMRQAGRILPEYRAVRARMGGFKELVENARLCRRSHYPARGSMLGVDAAIIFSDILVVPEAMGLPYEMIEAKGPRFPKRHPLGRRMWPPYAGRTPKTHLGYVLEAIRLVKRELAGRVPLIGFAGRALDHPGVYGRRQRLEDLQHRPPPAGGRTPRWPTTSCSASPM